MPYYNDYLLLKKYLLPLALKEGKVSLLEAGAGKKPWLTRVYRLCTESGWGYYFCDMMNYARNMEGFTEMDGDETVLSNPDRFDLVVTSEAIEHVRRPWAWVTELARVVKPGGLVAIVCCATWAWHRNPVDCWRILPDGMNVLMQEAKLEPLVSSLECLDQSEDVGRHMMNQVPGRHWDTIAIGRKPLGKT